MNLPLELWHHIAMVDSETYLLLVCTSKRFAIPAIKSHFTRITKHIRDGEELTVYSLPNGWVHREDGPAQTLSNNWMKWYYNNQLHRTDGPAIVMNSSDNIEYTLAWYAHGVQHRDNNMPSYVHALFHDIYILEWRKNGKHYGYGCYEGVHNRWLWL
jgi:hypothetical protein